MGFGQCPSEVLTGKTIVFGVEENALGDDVLIKGRVEFFDVVGPGGLEDPGDFRKTPSPVRHMM